MRTVKELKEELSKFPDDAVAFATEERGGLIVIQRTAEDAFNQGVIHCPDEIEPFAPTKLLP